MRLQYKDTLIGMRVKVQKYYDGLTDEFFEGTITNRDGQNIMVKTENGWEACNPKYAIVQEIRR